MKFSVKQLALFIAVCALLVAFVMTVMKLRQAESKIAELREIAGYRERRSEADHYSYFLCGWHAHDEDRANPHYGSILLRVDAHEKYALRMVSYDGITNANTAEQVDLNDAIVAITCIPSSTHKTFEVQSTYFTKQKTQFTFRSAIPGWDFYLNPQGAENHEINDECLVVYYFPVPSQTEHPDASIPCKTEADIQALCKQFKMRAITFRVVPR